MGVYIPHMKMPKSCWDCPLDTPVCDLWRNLRDSAYEEMTKKKHEDCPLIEVPAPHGRPYVAEIEAEYKKAVSQPWIHKPLAKALYEVWKKHDREDVSRHETD